METTLPLADRWSELRTAKPSLRIRDAAKELGVSELELLVLRPATEVVRLEGDWTQFLRDLSMLGHVMCLTRNEHAVHERHGEFLQVDFFHGMGQVVGPDIDLRLFMNQWRHGYAVTDQTAEGDRQSFQFFDATGTAVHKIYLQPDSNYGAFGVILNKFRSATPRPDLAIETSPAPRPEIPDAEIDVPGFRESWLAMNDTHAFYPLIQKFRVSRTQALRLAPEGFTRRLVTEAPKRLLEAASAAALPIMVFIGNRGCLQIHTGPVQNIRPFGSEWINVLDEKFNMHLRAPAVAEVWEVRKPTIDGIVTSVEIYDALGDNLVLFFGRRKPGEPEDPAWTRLVAELPVP